MFPHGITKPTGTRTGTEFGTCNFVVGPLSRKFRNEPTPKLVTPVPANHPHAGHSCQEFGLERWILRVKMTPTNYPCFSLQAVVRVPLDGEREVNYEYFRLVELGAGSRTNAVHQ